MHRRVALTIKGRVQGVFYRATAAEYAAGLGLTGYAQNLPGGSVKIVAEGMEATLKKFSAWAKEGPAGAQVDEVEENFEEATGEFKDFSIRY